MNNKVVYTLYHAFVDRGFAVLGFNFRGVGRSQGEFDHGAGELSDAASALDWLQTFNANARTCWVAGFSFGAWIALCRGIADSRITTLLAIAPPVGRYDFTAVATSQKPMHFIHGDVDELIPVAQMRAPYEEISEPKTLAVIDGANHLFDGKVAEVGDVIRARFEVRAEEQS